LFWVFDTRPGSFDRCYLKGDTGEGFFPNANLASGPRAVPAPCDTNNCVSIATCVNVNATNFTCDCPQTPYPSTGDGTLSGSGCSWVCPTPLTNTTILPPVLLPEESGFLSLGVLSIVWQWPTVQTRTLPVVTFVFPNTSVASNCTIPNYTVTTNGPCSQALTLNLPWSYATSNCGFYLSGQVGSGDSISNIWSGQFELAATETVSTEGRNTSITRSVTQQFTIQVTFAKYATVSTSVDVFASVLVTATIVDQQFGTNVAGTGQIQFVTQVGYPFMLVLVNDGGSLAIAPSNINTSLTAGSSSPANVTGGVSSQNWQFTVVPATGTCVLDGTYGTASNGYQLVCTPAAVSNNDCPQILDPNVSFSFGVTSSNYCGQVVADVGVTLLLTSYNDAAHQITSNNFLIQPNGVAYFGVTVLSSTQVLVSALQVSRVTLSSNGLGGALVLYNDGLTTAGITFGYAGTGPNFSFNLTTDFNVIRDSSDEVSVVALVTIFYTGNNGQKRFIETLAPASQTSSQVANSINLTPGLTSAGNMAIVAVVPIVFLVAVLFY